MAARHAGLLACVAVLSTLAAAAPAEAQPVRVGVRAQAPTHGPEPLRLSDDASYATRPASPDSAAPAGSHAGSVARWLGASAGSLGGGVLGYAGARRLTEGSSCAHECGPALVAFFMTAFGSLLGSAGAERLTAWAVGGRASIDGAMLGSAFGMLAAGIVVRHTTGASDDVAPLVVFPLVHGLVTTGGSWLFGFDP